MDATIRIEGVKQAINTLNKIDKELVRDFKRKVNEIAAPVIADTASEYAKVPTPLSGMARVWSRDTKTGSRRSMFPYSAAKAGAKLKTRYDTRRNSIGVILIQQTDPGAAIFEAAGRRNANRLATSLDQENGRGWEQGKPTRIMGPAVYRATRRGATDEIRQLVDDLMADTSRRLARRID